jgi:hypothetical protein
MKNYNNKTFVLALSLLISSIGYAQNIKLSIVNAQNTNDGSNDYYEADIMIQTIDGQADFKLGSGQLYFNYNTAAFGDNVYTNNRFEVTVDDGTEYFLGEKSGFTNFYDVSTYNDNSTSRVSWAFSQGVSSGAMTQMVSSSPRMMIHIKFKYADIRELPMVEFETDENLVSGCRDQFYTACGSYDSASTTLDCTPNVDPQNVNVQFQDATFESGGAVLSVNDKDKLIEFSIYPNPTKDLLYVDVNVKSKYRVIDMFGKIVKTGSFDQGKNELQLRNYEAGVYFLRVLNNNKIITKKVVLE